MDPYDFEELVAEVWEQQGYQTAVRKGSGDRGIDVEATRGAPYSEKVLIQAKRYAGKNKIGSDEVRKYATLYQQVQDADTVVIVTTGDVTSEAKRLARDLSVKVVDGDSFSGLVANHQNNLSIDSYTTQSQPNKNGDLTNIKTRAPGPFDKCPICSSKNMFIEGEKNLSCNRCSSVWVKEERKGKPQIWRGMAGEAKGKYGSRDEWRHHLNYINSTQGDISGNKQSSKNIHTTSNDVELGRVASTLLAAILAVPTTIVTMFVVGLPLFTIFPNIDMNYILLLSYLAALLFWLKIDSEVDDL